jgi:hypothetical protein
MGGANGHLRDSSNASYAKAPSSALHNDQIVELKAQLRSAEAELASLRGDKHKELMEEEPLIDAKIDLVMHAVGDKGANWLPRCVSYDLSNDPRVISDSIIGKRFAAFNTIAVGASLMVGLAFSTISTLSVASLFGLGGAAKGSKHTWSEEVCEAAIVVLMAVVCAMNLLCVLVLTQQYYQIFRLLTAGAHGFEIAKNYYKNPSIAFYRTLGCQCFFRSLPLFTLAIAIMCYGKFKEWSYGVSIALPIFCAVMALVTVYIQRTQWHLYNAFHEKGADLEDQAQYHGVSMHGLRSRKPAS